MNTKKVIALATLVVVFITLSSFKALTHSKDSVGTVLIQDGLTIHGIYDGHEDYGYNFITKDKEGDERMLTFQNIEATVLKTFDLNSETFIGTKFKVTFKKVVKVTKDEDDIEDEEELNTITMLEKV